MPCQRQQAAQSPDPQGHDLSTGDAKTHGGAPQPSRSLRRPAAVRAERGRQLPVRRNAAGRCEGWPGQTGRLRHRRPWPAQLSDSMGRMMTAMAGSCAGEMPKPSADASASSGSRRTSVSAARSASHRSIAADVEFGQEPLDVGQADAGPAQQRDTARGDDLVVRVTAVTGGAVDTGRDQQTALVVQSQRFDREPSSRGELGGSQFLHEAIIERAPGAG